MRFVEQPLDQRPARSDADTGAQASRYAKQPRCTKGLAQAASRPGQPRQTQRDAFLMPDLAVSDQAFCNIGRCPRRISLRLRLVTQS
jgi:hypothetical protein